MTDNRYSARLHSKPRASRRLIRSKSVWPKTVITSTALTALLASSGCATSSLLESNDRVSTKVTKELLSEDQILAFGRPAQALPKTPNATMVIVGQKNSYVLTQGGREMVQLLSSLTPSNIQVDNDMSFHVPSNDGHFQGEMKLSYAKLKDEFGRSDYQFFLQNQGQECTSKSDQRINAQRFCFRVPVKGTIYPPVSNLRAVQSNYHALSKPYAVSFYTQTEQDQVVHHGPNGVQKLVLLPFALAFDVVTFPIQLLDH